MIQLYSDSRCSFSHRARIILNKKDMEFKIIDVNTGIRSDLMILNPYNETPVLVDDIDKNDKKKNLILIEPSIICEYIDERFPHPQFMPMEPSEKSRLRMLIFYFDKELFIHLRVLDSLNYKDSKSKKEIERIKKLIISGIDGVSQMFQKNRNIKYLFGSSFTLLDAAVLPLLWRLQYYEIDEKPSWAGMLDYANYHFSQINFINSLTPAERGMMNV